MSMNQYLENHKRKYPVRTWQDDVKWMYQATMGAEHFVSDEAGSLERIRQEAKGPAGFVAEALSEKYVRIHFGALTDTQAIVFNRLFIATAQLRNGCQDILKDQLYAYTREYPESRSYIQQYIAAGCPAIHHSEVFRQAYQPSYRIIARRYWFYFGLLCDIELQQPRVIAIDGRCGSGKSTLGSLLSDMYHCPLFHMDDFYLPLAMRTKQRLSEPGGNVYYERFLEEVLEPLERDETIRYGVFDHRVMNVGSYRTVCPAKRYVIEGSYAFHPVLVAHYDYRIFLTINPAKQKERILKRNGPEVWKMFESRWIPLEEHYFQAHDFSHEADYVLDVSEND